MARLSSYASARGSTQKPAEQNELSLRKKLREQLYQEIPSDRIAQLIASGRAVARTELTAVIERILLNDEYKALSAQRKEHLIIETLDLILGLGPLEKLLNDDSVTEIMVNGASRIFYEREGLLYSSDERFLSEDQLRLVIDRIVSPLGRRIDEQSPIVNARLPEGHRVNAVIPPLSLDGSLLTIRKFRKQSYTLDDMVRMDSMTPEMAQLLIWAVQSRRNIAVSGGTGGGKTTLLNALSQQIPKNERIITIEDSAELRFDQHPHVVRMEARLANSEGNGAVTIRDLVINALRMRPDRIVVGECRGAEALDMLQAMNTGHDGSLTTLHANSPAEVVPRLVMMVRYGMDLPTPIIEAQISSALDIVVQQDRTSGGHRRVTQIVMRSTAHEAPDSFFTPIVTWNRLTKEYEWEHTPSWIDDLPFLEIACDEEVEQWHSSVSCCLSQAC